MKFVAFWEYYPEDFEKLVAKNEGVRQDRLQHPDKYPKNLLLHDDTGAARARNLKFMRQIALSNCPILMRYGQYSTLKHGNAGLYP